MDDAENNDEDNNADDGDFADTLRSWPRLLSTLMTLLAPSTTPSTLIAPPSSLHLLHSPRLPPLLLLLLLLGSTMEILT